MAVEFEATLYGWKATRKLMRELDPEAVKELDREVREALLPVVARARSLVPVAPPLSRWNQAIDQPGSRPRRSVYGRRWPYGRLEWNANEIKSGMRIRGGQSRPRGGVASAIYQVRNDSAAGAVFELMGRGKSNATMVGNVRARFGGPNPGRLLYKAFEQVGGQAIVVRLEDTIRRFERRFNDKLDRAGGVG